MPEPARHGDSTGDAAALSGHRGASFVSAQVVLEEHRAALQALGRGRNGWSPGRRVDLPQSIVDRSRLIELGIRVVAHAMVASETECRQILGAAEAHAAAIVKDARTDVARLALSVGRVVPAGGSGEVANAPAARNGPAPMTDAPVADVAVADVASGLTHYDADRADPDGEVGDMFFDSFSSEVGDPWGFMDNDDLVGVGPTIRRVLRRPVVPNPPVSRRGKP